MNLEAQLIDHLSRLHPEQRWLEYDGNRWCGTRALFDKGIKVCPDCGKMLPIEREYCACGERVFCDYSPQDGREPLRTVRIEMVKPRRGKVVRKGILVV